MIKQLDRNLYPEGLSQWRYKDRALWYEGDVSLLKMPMVSVIGSRDASDAGIMRAERITKLLVKAGYCIVSGLAKGIDTTAHICALRLKGKTIAVMGTPIEECYPKSNLSLKNEIAKEGLLLSQFAPGQKVSRSNFPLRNALMAALSEVTIVVEATVNSGTRHQVTSAIQMGKKVGIVKSMTGNGYEWVNEALSHNNVFTISEPYDLSSQLNAFEAPNKNDERDFSKVVPAPTLPWYNWVIAAMGFQKKQTTSHHFR